MVNSFTFQPLSVGIGRTPCSGTTSYGSICAVNGSSLTAILPLAAVGDLCLVTRRNRSPLPAQILAFSGEKVELSPLEDPYGVLPNARVENTHQPLAVEIPLEPFGTVLNCFGTPFSNQACLNAPAALSLPVTNSPLEPLERRPISKQLLTGIKAIDTLVPVGYGQRMGLLAGPGVGKSTLLGMIAEYAEVDVVVAALIGERGREIREFRDHCLSPKSRQRTIIIASTSDESASRRRLAALSATAIAEAYRDQGLNVLLVVDSLTRTARAIRDMTLDAGEFPVRQGFTSSVYREMPQLLERAGRTEHGSLTAIYTLLTESIEELDPLTHELKSLLDGHIVLSVDYAQRGIYPAIDPVKSVSRLRNRLCTPEQLTLIAEVNVLLTRSRRGQDLQYLSERRDPELEAAITAEKQIVETLEQKVNEHQYHLTTLKELQGCIEQYRSRKNESQLPGDPPPLSDEIDGVS